MEIKEGFGFKEIILENVDEFFELIRPDKKNINQYLESVNGKFIYRGQADSNWELGKRSNKRNKRVLDFILSFLMLLLSPILMWLSNSPTSFLNNMLNILKGEKTFVGFNQKYESHFPNIKKGILSPISYLDISNLDSNEVRNINMRYAKDYSARNDLYIIFKCLNQLG